MLYDVWPDKNVQPLLECWLDCWLEIVKVVVVLAAVLVQLARRLLWHSSHPTPAALYQVIVIWWPVPEGDLTLKATSSGFTFARFSFLWSNRSSGRLILSSLFMLLECFCLCTCCLCVGSSSAKQSSCEHPVMCQSKGTVSGSRQVTDLRAGIKFYFFYKMSYIFFLLRHPFLKLFVHCTGVAPACCQR